MCEQVSGNTTSLLVDGLDAFTNYSFYVAACTVAGCTSSNQSNVVTTLSYGRLLQDMRLFTYSLLYCIVFIRQ